jgi:hypothetical protein
MNRCSTEVTLEKLLAAATFSLILESIWKNFRK